MNKASAIIKPIAAPYSIFRKDIKAMNENLNTQVDETTEQTPTFITRKVGNMTYRVGIHFNDKSRETMGEKLKRMMKNECEGANSL